MMFEGLIRETERYDIQNEQPSSPAVPDILRTSRPREHLSLVESLYDPEVWEGSRLHLRPSDYVHSVAESIAEHALRARRDNSVRPSPLRPAPSSRLEPPAAVTIAPPDYNAWPLTEPISASFSSAAEDAENYPPLPFTVITESNGGDGYGANAYYGPYPATIPTAQRSQPDLSDDNEDYQSTISVPSALQVEVPAELAYRDTEDPAFVAAMMAAEAEANEATAALDDAGVVASTSGLREPHAEFYIAKNRSKITVKFDPPV